MRIDSLAEGDAVGDAKAGPPGLSQYRPVAVRLAGGGDFKNVVAGKPDCYGGSAFVQRNDGVGDDAIAGERAPTTH
ncbi:hypothetical protein ACIPL1_22510 [Pseudomonas sp. NPDC090202]|uniref:hypothetical protein n=1 Tax=unclassified Pseudomonas TaxID=196821 RepID=UPI003826D1C3